MHVYTPPGYDSSTEKLPVFYLLHGGGDDDLGWSTIGRAGFIVDNLLAAKKAVPMIVVMPNGSMPRPANMPRFTPGSTPSPEARSAMEAFQNRFTNELLKDIIPFTEAHYRVKTGRDNRALAGLSMGGGQTLRVLTANPDQFGQIGIWMPACSAAMQMNLRNGMNRFSKPPITLTRRSSCCRSVSETKTSHWKDQRRLWACSIRTGSNMRYISAAAAIHGSTGDIT